VTRGFEASAAFLGAIALAAMVLSALHGKNQLNSDDVLPAG
jgi:hypothetical protein